MTPESYQTKLAQMSLAKSWAVVILISFFFFFEFGLGNAFNTLTPAILVAYPDLTHVGVSFIASLYFYTNIACLTPAAYILDRFSPRLAISIALLVCALSIFVMTLTANIYVMGASRLLMGVGASFSLIGCVRIATNWFPSYRLGFVIGIIIAIGMLGGYVAQAPVGYLLDLLGLKYALDVIALFGACLAVLIFLLVQDTPKELIAFRQVQTEALKAESVIQTLKLVLTKPQNWCAGIYVGLINIGTWMLGGMWSNAYLIKTHGVSILEARSITGYIFLGMIFAYPFWGWFTERMCRRKQPLILGGIGSVVIISAIMFCTVSVTQLSVLFFLLGFVTSAQAIAYPFVGETNPMKNNAVATSIVSMNSLLWGGVIAMPLFGMLTSWFNQSKGLEDMAAPGLDFGMGILLIGFIISIMFAFLIKETYCKRQID
ncbi:MFS transporter [Caedibacter taeniospiralis]|uniref:MFS transporter n=1 Tax=Caedibacter taeniospiralis TaxID=28907 RepID=UPI000C272917|nr:MFS transporter [Caedibacter taeniospiralis]